MAVITGQVSKVDLPSGEFVGRIGLAVSAASPDTLYASIDNQQPLPEDQWELGDRPVNAKRLRHMSKEEFLAQDKNEIESFIRSSDFRCQHRCRQADRMGQNR